MADNEYLTARPNHKRIEPFDPGPSAGVAADILRAVQAPYALIGRIAVWAYLPTSEQEFTKDLDIAVPEDAIAAVEKELKQRGFECFSLTIGGFGIRQGQLSIDFIDRRQYHGRLFREAVRAASEQALTITVGQAELPLVPCEYLVAMKMISGESKDDTDVKRLLRNQELNYRKTRQIVFEHLGPVTAERLDVWAREAGRPEVPQRGPYESDNKIV